MKVLSYTVRARDTSRHNYACLTRTRSGLL